MFDLVVVGLCTDAVLQVAGFYLEESRRSNEKNVVFNCEFV
jgi:hypothetical protein